MTKECTLVILDEVNIKFIGLDSSTRRKLVDKVKYLNPVARFTPAYKLGRWDGLIRYCDIGGRSYLNLLDKLIPVVQNDGYYINIDDQRDSYNFEFELVDKDMFSNISWPDGHPAAGEPIQLREYQIEYINSFLGSPQGIGVAPTAGGKTLCTAALSKRIEKYGRSIVIVPNRDLVIQTQKAYEMLGLDVGVYFGATKDWNKKHTICTWQSLEILNKKNKDKFDPEFPLNEFIDNVAGVIVDEVHKVNGAVLRSMLSEPFKNIPIRWGLTGTVPTEEFQQIAMISVIGDILGNITAKELQDKGYLANLHINVQQYQDEVLSFRTYHDEQSWIVNHKKRTEFLANEIVEIAKTGNTLVLVDRKVTGTMLNEFIPDSKFVYGNIKSAERHEQYEKINYSQNSITIATYGVASTGIDIPRIFNLVLFEPGKSFIKVIQSIGRGIRIAKDKSFVQVYDVCSTHKYSKRHLGQRKKYYNEVEYPYEINKVYYK